MLFSVVIPLYNKSYSIKYCIDSVLSQSYKNFEIIIVNDGSTDDSKQKVIKNYSKEISSGKIRLITQSNAGVSVARNNGVNVSNSEFICFLDADDEWKPHFLHTMMKLITDFPKANLYCLEHETQINKQKPYVRQSLFKYGFRGYLPNFFLASLKSNIANSSKVCVRKMALLEIGAFPEGQKAGEDIFVWMELARISKVAYANIISTKINIINDESRTGRNATVPYPIIYYSLPGNAKKLTIFSKLYLRKLHLAHVNASLKEKNYDTALLRVEASKDLFPLMYKLLLPFLYTKIK